MTISPGTIQLAEMLDDPDHDVGINVLAQLLAREDEAGELARILQEHSDPLVRRRVHMLQNAIVMRRRRRDICAMLNQEQDAQTDIIGALTALHLLWFDKDHPDEVDRDVQNFLALKEKFPVNSLTDLEFFMRKHCFLPENETTIRPESYCIGTVIFHHLGATSVLMAIGHALLADAKKYRLVKVMGQFGILDEQNNLLLGNGAWRLTAVRGDENIEVWSSCKLLRYIALTLLSCAVNSDSYRYVMSITQALTGDESEHVFDDFPYPFCSNPENPDNGGDFKSHSKKD